DKADIRGLDDHDEFAPRVATVDLRSGQRFDCAGGRGEPLRPGLDQNAGNLGNRTGFTAGLFRPLAVDELSAVDVGRRRWIDHGMPYLDGGPGGPLIACEITT